MKSIQRVALILSVFLIAGCGLFNRVVAPAATPQPVPNSAASTATPLAKAPVAPTAAGPTQDACAQEPLRAYLRAFAVPMGEYELSLFQVLGLSLRMGGATKEELTAAVSQAQSARDSIAAMPTPYCAQKMQADLLSSMDHTIAAIKLNIAGAPQAQAEAEMSQAKAEQATVEAEFGALTAKAGLDAASPTP